MFFTKADNNATVTTSSASWVRTPATAEDLRRFQVHQTQAGMQPPSSSVSTLRFFFSATLRPARSFPPPHDKSISRRKLPLVLSVEEVARLLEAAPGPKCKAALGTAYGAPAAGCPRVVALKVTDINSARMLIRFEQGRGRKDRHAMLSP